MPVASEELIARIITGQTETMMAHKRRSGIVSAGEELRLLDLTREHTELSRAGRKLRNRDAWGIGVDEWVAEDFISAQILRILSTKYAATRPLASLALC